MQKGFTPILIIVGLLFIATVVGGVFYLGVSTGRKIEIGQQLVNIVNQSPQPNSSDNTPNPTTSLEQTTKAQTIRVNQLSFNIPSDWWYQSFDGQYPGDKTVAINPTSLPVPGDAVSAFILTVETDKSLPIKVEEIKKSLVASSVKETTVDLGGLSAVILEGTQPAGMRDAVDLKFAVSQYGRTTYTLEDNNTIENHNTIFDQIIASYKFVLKTAKKGESCMGRSLAECDSGLKCQRREGAIEDASGICVKE